MRNFKDLKVWAKAHQLTLDLYRTTRSFPQSELYSLTTQIRRAAASIGANLAEGCGRLTDPEMGRFLQIAMGSASELDYHLLLARDLQLLKATDYERLSPALAEVRRMLTSLIQRVRAA